MAALSSSLHKLNTATTPPTSSRRLHKPLTASCFFQYTFFARKLQSCNYIKANQRSSFSYKICSRRLFIEDDDEEENGCCSFDEAVELFNSREYYRCHDVLETIWSESQDPSRSLVHGILQCAVGLHHLFNQNHRGAMMELGEGLCKLRKLNFESGPFHQFGEEVAAVLDFIYETQLEHAACTEDICVAMDQSERSYQLLGGYGAGQPLYRLEGEHDNSFIVFCTERSHGAEENRRIQLPLLRASEDHLLLLEHN